MDDGTGVRGGNFDELRAGTSYHLCQGADTLRPTSAYSNTRNQSADDLGAAGAQWRGSDTDPTHDATLSGLTDSQGQVVTSDGGARQSNDADLTDTGTLSKAADKATGGVATGVTSLKAIK